MDDSNVVTFRDARDIMENVEADEMGNHSGSLAENASVASDRHSEHEDHSVHADSENEDNENILVHRFTRILRSAVTAIKFQLRKEMFDLREDFYSFKREITSMMKYEGENQNENTHNEARTCRLGRDEPIFQSSTPKPQTLDRETIRRHSDAPSLARHNNDYISPLARHDVTHVLNDNNAASKLGKMKPWTYDGTEDLNEYLTHFNIVAKLNGWDHKLRSLYLASSLTGGARALLNDLDSDKQEDYDSLVEALKSRYGTANRAEVFKTQLQTRSRQKNESIQELAQAILKLAKKAYPTANSEMIEVLALDHFIDALPQPDLRLRVREMRPKNIMEAEKTAVTLEAFRLADKQREKNLRVIEAGANDKDGESLEDQVKKLTQEEDQMRRGSNYQQQRGRPSYRGRGGYRGQWARTGQDGRPHHTAQNQGQGNR